MMKRDFNWCLMRKMLIFVAVFVLEPTQCVGENAPKHTYETVRIAEGITAFIASESNTDIVSGNSVAIVGDNGVLVVDSTNFPSQARQMIDEIKRMTNEPVRFVVHTHWHLDHLMGDAAYRAAFPGVIFVSTAATKKAIVERDPKYLKFADFGPQYAANLRKQLREGKDEEGKPLTDADRKYLTDFANSVDFAIGEFKQATLVAPDLTFDHDLTINLGRREVKVLFLGRGNTGGDAVIFVPDSKVVMAGDLLVFPTPYSYGSYLTEWIQTLAKVKALGASVIVPGHGPVEHDYSYLDLVSSLLQSVVTQVQQAESQGLKLEDVRKKVDLSTFEKRFAGDDHDRRVAFRSGFTQPAVERAYQETKFGDEE
jgi:glyoxylase-like metal-dependent hydrolase (beta-lactamase superfamily II)